MSIELPDDLKYLREYLQSKLTSKEIEELIVFCYMININNLEFKIPSLPLKTEIVSFIFFSWN